MQIAVANVQAKTKYVSTHAKRSNFFPQYYSIILLLKGKSMVSNVTFLAT